MDGFVVFDQTWNAYENPEYIRCIPFLQFFLPQILPQMQDMTRNRITQWNQPWKYYHTTWNKKPKHLKLPNAIKPSSKPKKPNKTVPKKTKAVDDGGNKGAKVKNTFTEDPVEEAFSNEKLRRTLQSVTLLPRQKYKAPQTANQEIGWFAHTAKEEKDNWY